MSATNNAVAYDRALSYRRQKLDAEPGGWRFGMKLTTEHVWDSFVLWVLLKLHFRQHRSSPWFTEGPVYSTDERT